MTEVLHTPHRTLGPCPLQKLLQRLGVGSRREVRALIAAGRVRVGDEVVRRFAHPVDPHVAISVDGKTVAEPGPRAVILMHKPKKHLTAFADRGDQSGLGRYLPADVPRVFPVGRLDFNTEGALLWTNDGVLARRILHPEHGLPKRYAVKIRGHLEPDDPGLRRMAAGMTVGRLAFQPVEVAMGPRRTRATWIELVLREGKHRQIRKMCHACGYQIVKLRRTAIGPIALGDLRPRCVRVLEPDEVAALDQAVNLCAAPFSRPAPSGNTMPTND